VGELHAYAKATAGRLAALEAQVAAAERAHGGGSTMRQLLGDVGQLLGGADGVQPAVGSEESPLPPVAVPAVAKNKKGGMLGSLGLW
jgi:hypothetical protein